MQTSDILIRWHHYRETIGKQAFGVLFTLIVQHTMMSHVPFKNQKPIIDIAPTHVTTELVTFTTSTGAGQFYIDLVDGSYKVRRERITRIATTEARTMGKTTPFGIRWRFLRIISGVLILAPASMDPEISLSTQFWSLPFTVADRGKLNLTMLRMVISECAKASPGKTDQIPPPQNVEGMMYHQINTAFRFGAPN
jgi:hypothetical protein